MSSTSLILLDALEAVNNFFDSGGFVLYLIAILTFVMWSLILERVWYFKFTFKKDFNHALQTWENREERQSWFAHAIREKLISEVKIKVNQNIALMKTIIALAPLFGLLGTVTGMIEVFTVLAITGGGDAKSMAGGVSSATIPAMAGMVALLSGLVALIYINQKASTNHHLMAEKLTMDH